MLTFTHSQVSSLYTLRFVHVSLSLTHLYKTHLQSSSQSLLRVSPSIHNTQKCLTCRATFRVPVWLGVLWEPPLCLCWLADDSIWFCLKCVLSKASRLEHWTLLRIQDLSTLEHKIRNKTKRSEDHTKACSLSDMAGRKALPHCSGDKWFMSIGMGLKKHHQWWIQLYLLRSRKPSLLGHTEYTKDLKPEQTAISSAEWWPTLQPQITQANAASLTHLG